MYSILLKKALAVLRAMPPLPFPPYATTITSLVLGLTSMG